MTNWILGDKFNERYDHLDSIQALWEKKWKFPVINPFSILQWLALTVLQAQKSVYPFHDGKYEDFEKVFGELIKVRLSDCQIASNAAIGGGICAADAQHRITFMTHTAMTGRRPSCPLQRI